MSFLLNVKIFSFSFKKNLGNINAPIKKNKNEIINVSVRLNEMGLKDSDRNAAKTTKTMIGLNK